MVVAGGDQNLEAVLVGESDHLLLEKEQLGVNMF